MSLKTIPEIIAKIVIERDGGKCYLCPNKYEHKHHVFARNVPIPKELGDYTDVDNNDYEENIICLCANCHRRVEEGEIMKSNKDKIAIFRRNKFLKRIKEMKK